MRGNTSTISLTSFRADWLQHVPMRDLCDRYSITRDQAIRLKHVWELPPRHDRKLRAKPKRQRDPTADEIRTRCLEIQSRWTDEIREQRSTIKAQHVSLKRIEIPGEVRKWVDFEPSQDVSEESTLQGNDDILPDFTPESGSDS